MNEVWHYGIDGTRHGPVNREELLRVLRSGEFDPQRDKVWTAGMAEWASPSEVPELNRKPSIPQFGTPGKLLTSLFSGPSNSASAKRSEAKWQRMSWEVWAGIQAGYLAFNLLFILQANRSLAAGVMPGPAAKLFETLALACLIGATCMAVMAVWRNWEIIQGRGARTTPQKAILLLFIPFFNAYWIWTAALGLAEDYNRFADAEHEKGSDNPPRHEPRHFRNLAIALGIKYALLLASAMLMAVKLMQSSKAMPSLTSVTELELLEMQMASAHWNLLGVFIFGVALFPVMRDVFRAVNHYAEPPE